MTLNECPRNVRTALNLSNVKLRISRKKRIPQKQKSIAKSLNTSVATINKIKNQDLQFKKAKKHNVHQLLSRLVVQRGAFNQNSV